ncbi:Cyclic AMP-dependent transcription factor ATF-7 [Podila epicladia]|nr:Cyclic AMP-dependent transcription factor ATF-7 [Podila epicladia]KAG0098778.1 Cyclic AMP-dependent transcription factor ATF-7 [Podila epicladia]
MSAPAMSFLHADIRRDANPTPTRFLLECGAFTPGFGFNLDSSFNPFDASYKFLNTGTPKAELNPFDTSFKAPSIISVGSSSSNSKSNNTALKDKSLESLDMDHSRPNTMMDVKKMTPNSPDFSPSYSSSSSFSASPSPQPHSPPMNPTLFQVSFPLAGVSSEIRSNAHSVYENSIQNNVLEPSTIFHKNPIFSHTNQVGATAQTAYDYIDHHMNMEENDLMGSPRECMDQDKEDADYSEEQELPLSPKKATATKSHKAIKSPDTSRAGKGAKSRKRKTEQLSPEAKRQRFLERNRKAASKCREKKRLQTLQIINDADTITARNQELHENLAELEEEVRRLKNLILRHRDCGCDVIQKFVQSFDDGRSSSSPSSSFEYPSSSSSSSSLSMSMMAASSPTAFAFSMPSSIF